MGFRTGAYATIWEAPKPVSETLSKARISISKKNRQTGEYETSFSGYVAFCGTAAVNKASKLQVKDRIKLVDVDVENKYDNVARKEYWNARIWSFEEVNDEPQSNSRVDSKAAYNGGTTKDASSNDNNPVDGGEDITDGDEQLPF